MLKKTPKPNQVLDAFFKPQVPLNPSTVSAPLPIRPDDASIAALECHALGRTESHAHGACHIPTEKQTSSIRICQKGVSLLQCFEEAVSQIPSDTPSVTPEHHLSMFTVKLLRLGGPSAKARLGEGSLDHLMEVKDFDRTLLI